jgi:hypothetical protein
MGREKKIGKLRPSVFFIVPDHLTRELLTILIGGIPSFEQMKLSGSAFVAVF